MSLLSFQYVKSQIKSPIERVEAAVLFYKLNYEGFGRQLNLEVYNKEIIFQKPVLSLGVNFFSLGWSYLDMNSLYFITLQLSSNFF